MADTDARAKDKEVLSLGMAALIGKAMNDQKILDALLQAKGNKEQLYKVAHDRACIDLDDCDLEVLLKAVTGNWTIIDLIKIAKDCLAQQDPPPDPKWRD